MRITRLTTLTALSSLVLFVLACSQLTAQQYTWTNSHTLGDWLNVAPVSGWLPVAVPPAPNQHPGVINSASVNNGSTVDLAAFGNPLSAGSNIGIDMFVAVGQLQLGAISFNSTNTAYTIGNSSTTTSGILRLNGTTVNTATGLSAGGSAGMILVIADSSTQNATFQNTVPIGTQTMGISLGTTNGGIYVTTGRTLTLNNIVSQSSAGNGFTKSGSGTLLLMQDNTFSGAVTISGGTVQIGTGGTTGNLGTGTSGILNNGTLLVNRSNSLTLVNAISGTGSLVKSGAGTLILTGVNSYGTTTINTGTLQIGNSSTTGSLGSGTVTNNSSLVFQRSNTITATNAVNGSGAVTNNGTGTLTLSGALTFAGSLTNNSGIMRLTSNSNSYGLTQINGGTLSIGTGGTGGTLGTGTVTNNGALIFNRSNNHTVNNQINGAGSVTKNGVGKTTLTAAHGFTGAISILNGTLEIGNGGVVGSLASGGGITFTTASGSLSSNRSNNVTYSSVFGGRSLSGSGTFIKDGTGSLALDMALSFSGNTTVQAGRLDVNSSLTTNQVFVANGGVLAGSGSINGNVLVDITGTLAGTPTIIGNVDMTAGGILSPGNSPGTLAIVGDLTLAAGSILNFDLNETNQTIGGGINDLVSITGNLSLDGILDVSGIPTNAFNIATSPTAWVLFTYTGTLVDNGLVLGTLPILSPGGRYWLVDTSVNGQVRLLAVPEPACGFVSLALAGLVLGARRRRTV